MNLADRAFRNTIFNAAALVFQTAAAIFVWAMIARYLGPANTGEYALLAWIMVALCVVSVAGLPQTMTKYIAEYIGRGEADSAVSLAGRFIGWALAATALVLGLAAAGYLLHPAEIRPAVAVLVLAGVAPLTLYELFYAVLSGRQEYRQVAALSLFASAVQLVLIPAALLLSPTLEAIMAAVVVKNYASAALGWKLCFRHLRNRGAVRFPRATTLRMARFSAVTFCSSLLALILWQRSEVVLLDRYSTAAEIGFFALAYAGFDKMQSIAVTFTTVLFPLSSETYGRFGAQRLASMFSRSIRYAQMVLVPAAIGGMAVAQPVVRLLYGPSFLAVVPVLQVLLAAMSITCLYGIAQAMLYATEHEGFELRLWSVLALVNLGLALWWIPAGGAFGAACAKGAVQLASTVVSLAYVAHLVGGIFPVVSSARIYGASLLSAVVVMAVRWSGASPAVVVAFIPASGAAYLLLLWCMGEIGQAEVEILRRWLHGAGYQETAAAAAAATTNSVKGF